MRQICGPVIVFPIDSTQEVFRKESPSLKFIFSDQLALFNWYSVVYMLLFGRGGGVVTFLNGHLYIFLAFIA